MSKPNLKDKTKTKIKIAKQVSEDKEYDEMDTILPERLTHIADYIKPDSVLYNNPYEMYMMSSILENNDKKNTLPELEQKINSIKDSGQNNYFFDLDIPLFNKYQWKNIQELSIYINNANDDTDGFEVCIRCGSTNTTLTSVQTRGLDEAATQFIKCKSCGTNNRIN